MFMKMLAIVQDQVKNKAVCILGKIIRECVLMSVSCFHMDQIDHAVCRPFVPVYPVVMCS